jgi:hypothetical protein
MPGTGIRTPPGSHILWRPATGTAPTGSTAAFPGPGSLKGSGPLDDLDRRPGRPGACAQIWSDGMQIGRNDGIRASWTRFPPLILWAVIRDQLRRQAVMAPCAMQDGRVPPPSQSRVPLSDQGGSAGQQRQKRKRVRPPGSAAKVTIAERGSMRYTFHGGGPCAGALNGAVMPDPLPSGSAGQPLSAHAFAMRASAPGSVTRVASPSMTTSASRTDTAIEHRGSRATLRPLRVPEPVWNQNAPSTHRAPTAGRLR